MNNPPLIKKYSYENSMLRFIAISNIRLSKKIYFIKVSWNLTKLSTTNKIQRNKYSQFTFRIRKIQYEIITLHIYVFVIMIYAIKEKFDLRIEY